MQGKEGAQHGGVEWRQAGDGRTDGRHISQISSNSSVRSSEPTIREEEEEEEEEEEGAWHYYY